MDSRLIQHLWTKFFVLLYVGLQVSAHYNYEPFAIPTELSHTGIKTRVYKAQVENDTNIKALEYYSSNYPPVRNIYRSCARNFARQRKLANNNNLPSLAIVVNSAVNHHDARNTIRQTWYKKERAPDDLFVLNTYFFVGKCGPSNELPETWPETVCKKHSVSVSDWSEDICRRAIRDEALEFGDILQSNIVDTLYNQTKKASTIIEWLSNECQPDFVVIIDDDYDFSIRNLYKFLLENVSVNQTKKELFTHSSNRFSRKKNSTDKSTTLLNLKDNDAYIGYGYIKPKPVRDPESAGYISKDEYPNEYYPDFVDFGFVFMSKSTIDKLFRKMNDVEMFLISDVWIGIIAESLKIKPAFSMSFYCEDTILDLLSNECVAWPNYDVTKLKKHWDKRRRIEETTKDCVNEEELSFLIYIGCKIKYYYHAVFNG